MKLTREEIINRFETMEPFVPVDGEWFLPSIPQDLTKNEHELIVKNLIRCGAIPKKDLIIGREYEGDCRNAGQAKWNGETFEYTRYKISGTFVDKINHFEDDNNYDLFIPMKLIDEEE